VEEDPIQHCLYLENPLRGIRYINRCCPNTECQSLSTSSSDSIDHTLASLGNLDGPGLLPAKINTNLPPSCDGTPVTNLESTASSSSFDPIKLNNLADNHVSLAEDLEFLSFREETMKKISSKPLPLSYQGTSAFAF